MSGGEEYSYNVKEPDGADGFRVDETERDVSDGMRTKCQVASMKRKYYECGIAVMNVLAKVFWVTKRCRIIIDYDPETELLKVYHDVTPDA